MSAAFAAVLITVSQVTTAEAKQMAECLGLETPGQACPHQLMWVPRLACVAPVQDPWHVVGAGHGDVAFLHSQTQLVVESHPLDQCLRELAFFQAKVWFVTVAGAGCGAAVVIVRLHHRPISMLSRQKPKPGPSQLLAQVHRRCTPLLTTLVRLVLRGLPLSWWL